MSVGISFEFAIVPLVGVASDSCCIESGFASFLAPCCARRPRLDLIISHDAAWRRQIAPGARAARCRPRVYNLPPQSPADARQTGEEPVAARAFRATPTALVA